MTDTPFTDSRTYGFTDEDGIHCEAVHADFARKLERERDEARAALQRITESDMRWSKKIARDALEVTK